MSILAYGLCGAALYGALLYGVHLFYSRQQRRHIAAGAVFRTRMRKHVLKGWIWS